MQSSASWHHAGSLIALHLAAHHINAHATQSRAHVTRTHAAPHTGRQSYVPAPALMQSYVSTDRCTHAPAPHTHTAPVPMRAHIPTCNDQPCAPMHTDERDDTMRRSKKPRTARYAIMERAALV